MKWHTAKVLFRHKARKNARRQMYEERIVLLRAVNFDSAEKKAIADATKYATALGSCEFVEVLEIYSLDDTSPLGEFDEIYSRMYSSNLAPQQFTRTFFPPNHLDDCEQHGLKHRWFKKDESMDGCYHCLQTRPSKIGNRQP